MAFERLRGWHAFFGLVLYFGRPLSIAALVLYLFIRYDAWRDPVALGLGLLAALLAAGWRLQMIALRRRVRKQLDSDGFPAP